MTRAIPAIGIGILTCAITATAYGQMCSIGEPPSDFCSTARVIDGSPGQHVVLMDASNATGFNETIWGSPAGSSVWFEVTPTVSGPLTFSTCHPNTQYDTVVEAFDGTSCEFRNSLNGNDDTQVAECDNGCAFWGSVVTINATAGTRYWFVVGAVRNNNARCPLCLGVIVTIEPTCGDPPRGFACGMARELSGGAGSQYVEIDAGDMPSFPEDWNCATNVGYNQWFVFRPTVDGVATFSTCTPHTSYDTVVRATVGDCAGLMATIACNDDTFESDCINACNGSPRGSRVTFPVTIGGEYYIEVGAYNDNGAGCPLCLGATLDIVDCAAASPPVAELTLPPEIGAGCACEPVDIVGSAYDPNGVFGSYTLEYRPTGTSLWTQFASGNTPQVNGVLGGWPTASLGQGYYLIRLNAVNQCGKTASDTRVVFLDKTFDTLRLDYPPDPAVIGHTPILGGDICLTGTVFESWCWHVAQGAHYTARYRRVGDANWSDVTPGTSTYTSTRVNQGIASWDTRGMGLANGSYELLVTAQNDCGNTAQVQRSLILDNSPPEARIDDPLNCQIRTGPVPISGRAFDDNIDFWIVEYTGGTAHGWVPIDSGNASVPGGLLTVWDTTGLPPCAYTIRLRVYDRAVLNCDSVARQWREYTTSIELGGGPDCPEDIDGNGVIDLTDLAMLLSVFGTPCP